MTEAEPKPNLEPRRLKFRIIVIATAFLVLGALFFVSSLRDEPIHSGKPLSYWLTALNGPQEGRLAATNAILVMGTNIVPHLLQMRFAQEAKFESFFGGIIRFLKKNYQTPTEKGRYLAQRGLRSLGASAAPFLIPYLSNDDFLHSQRKRHYHYHPAKQAADVFFFDIGASAIPALVSAMTNADVSIRYHACYLFVQGSGGGILNSPHSNTVIPALIERLKDPDFRVRQAAISATGQIAQQTRFEIPNLVSNICLRLDDSFSSVRMNAAAKLGSLKENARMAVPHLLKALAQERTRNTNTVEGDTIFSERSYEQVEFSIKDAVRQIDPQAYAKLMDN